MALALVTGLVGCGGGGGGGGASRTSEPAYVGLAGICTPEAEKRFIRSYMDEVYLWFDEIPAVNAASFSTAVAYFRALLVRTPDANGLPRDRFSGVITTREADALQARSLPAGNDLPTAATLDSLLSATTTSVPLATTLTATLSAGNNATVGYVLFNDHSIGAQDELIAAFRKLQAAGVNELVLDLRFNSGGYLYVARTAASMVTGPQNDSQVFERLRFNSKRPQESSSNVFNFSSTVETAESASPIGTALPRLNLSRLYVLTSADTCSASESIINSLRGVNVPVVLIGDTTCGKPFGFRRKDNCGQAYFPIEFQGYNAAGFGDYTTGFAPTCRVVPEAMPVLGSSSERLLATALRHIETGTRNDACPP